MHDLDLARLVHAEREREIAKDLRIRAFRVAQKDREDAFVPPPADQPSRIAHALRLVANPRRG
jgi:hypothetical protein